jgi:hypothetical protein
LKDGCGHVFAFYSPIPNIYRRSGR